MNASGYFKMIDELNKKRTTIAISKAKDYATEDILSNFKRLSTASKALDISTYSPEGYAMFMILMKLDRINNILKKKQSPKNEPLEDSIMDMINYTFLLYGIIQERNTSEIITQDQS